MRYSLLISIISASLIVSGCAIKRSEHYENRNGATSASSGFFQSSDKEDVIDLTKELKKTHKPLFDRMVEPLNKEAAVLVTSLVNIDDLDSTSTFGRIAAETIATGLTDRGYRITEVKLSNNLFIREKSGEFMLSRNLEKISADYDALAVLVGTYAISPNKVYINTRLVNTTNGLVISAHDFELPATRDIRYLLRSRKNK